MRVKIIGMEPLRLNIEGFPDAATIQVKFECMRCKHKYYVYEEDSEGCDAFLKSLRTPNPTKFIGCPKCDDEKQERHLFVKRNN